MDPLKEKDADGASQPAKAEAAVDFARLIGRLKTTPRTGWVRRGVPRYESVADHSWRVAALAFLLKGDVDVAKCLSLAVVHDMAEAVVGDIAPDDHVSKEDKQKREQEAMETIVATLQKATTGSTGAANESASVKQLHDLFHEYEQRESAEAIAVKDLDLLDMIVQADEYEEAFGMDLEDFFVGTPPSRFCTPDLQTVAEAVHQRRRRRREITKEEDSTMAGLSLKDTAFVKEYARASKLGSSDIEQVVKALREWDATIPQVR
jgi:putative hydrolase of HD superfamily